jgi:hypothetical protein
MYVNLVAEPEGSTPLKQSPPLDMILRLSIRLPPHNPSSIFMLFSHLILGLPSCRFPRSVPKKFFMHALYFIRGGRYVSKK